MRHSIKIFVVFILLELVIAIGAIVFDGFTIEALQTTTRYSARLSLLLFSVIFLLKHRPGHGARWISTRPYLLFAVVHGIHLIELLAYVYLSKANLMPIRLLGGFIAYLFIFIMPLLDGLNSAGKITRLRYTRIELVFQYYIWFIFFMSYLPRILGKLPNAGGSFQEHIVLFCWVIIILGIKLMTAVNLRPARNV
jgi:hypothetical protein